MVGRGYKSASRMTLTLSPKCKYEIAEDIIMLEPRIAVLQFGRPVGHDRSRCSPLFQVTLTSRYVNILVSPSISLVSLSVEPIIHSLDVSNLAGQIGRRLRFELVTREF